MPDCLQRPPTSVLQADFTGPLPIGSPRGTIIRIIHPLGILLQIHIKSAQGFSCRFRSQTLTQFLHGLVCRPLLASQGSSKRDRDHALLSCVPSPKTALAASCAFWLRRYQSSIVFILANELGIQRTTLASRCLHSARCRRRQERNRKGKWGLTGSLAILYPAPLRLFRVPLLLFLLLFCRVLDASDLLVGQSHPPAPELRPRGVATLCRVRSRWAAGRRTRGGCRP